jgi:membrane fusion protein, multidrug efflux system
VVIVPTAAVQRGPDGTFVFVVQPNNRVAIRPVTVAQQDENQAVISNGLQADERVVTTGFARLTASSEVAVTEAETGPPPSVHPAAESTRERRRDRRDRRSEAATSAPR